MDASFARYANALLEREGQFPPYIFREAVRHWGTPITAWLQGGVEEHVEKPDWERAFSYLVRLESASISFKRCKKLATRINRFGEGLLRLTTQISLLKHLDDKARLDLIKHLLVGYCLERRPDLVRYFIYDYDSGVRVRFGAEMLHYLKNILDLKAKINVGLGDQAISVYILSNLLANDKAIGLLDMTMQVHESELAQMVDSNLDIEPLGRFTDELVEERSEAFPYRVMGPKNKLLADAINSLNRRYRVTLNCFLDYSESRKWPGLSPAKPKESKSRSGAGRSTEAPPRYTDWKFGWVFRQRDEVRYLILDQQPVLSICFFPATAFKNFPQWMHEIGEQIGTEITEALTESVDEVRANAPALFGLSPEQTVRELASIADCSSSNGKLLALLDSHNPLWRLPKNYGLRPLASGFLSVLDLKLSGDSLSNIVLSCEYLHSKLQEVNNEEEQNES